MKSAIMCSDKMIDISCLKNIDKTDNFLGYDIVKQYCDTKNEFNLLKNEDLKDFEQFLKDVNIYYASLNLSEKYENVKLQIVSLRNEDTSVLLTNGLRYLKTIADICRYWLPINKKFGLFECNVYENFYLKQWKCYLHNDILFFVDENGDIVSYVDKDNVEYTTHDEKMTELKKIIQTLQKNQL